MKWFSLRRIGDATGRTVRRFPFVLLAAVVTGVSAAVMIDADLNEYGWRSAMMSGALGIPLFLTIALVAERREAWRLPRFFGPAASLLGAVLLAVYGASLPRLLRETDLYLYAQLSIGLHLSVAVLPFALRGPWQGMWQFNLALLMRFLTAAFFTAVLYAGLSVALLALDELLGVNIDDETYAQLWFLTCFIFNTAYFLGGVPEGLTDRDRLAARPPIVRIFAQYILTPLVMVYLVILLVYLVKVVVTAEWPSGWIGYLVSSVAVAGLLSLLLLKPELDRAERTWVRVYSRLYHTLMVPAVAMLALAIFKRIGQYGVTEPRYFLVVLTLWLAAMVVVGCWRPSPPLRVIPATLAALAFLTAVGPWSAYAVAHRSQLARLEGLLAVQSRFDGERFTAAETPVKPRDQREISGLLYYLFDHFGADALGDAADDTLRVKLVAEAMQDPGGLAPAIGLAATAAEHLNLEYTADWAPRLRGSFDFERVDRLRAVPVAGWDHLASFYLSGDGEEVFVLEADTCKITVDWPGERLVLTRRGESFAIVPLATTMARLRDYADEIGGRTVPDSLLDATGASASAHLWLRAEVLWWSEDDDGRVTSGTVHGALLIDLTGE